MTVKRTLRAGDLVTALEGTFGGRVGRVETITHSGKSAHVRWSDTNTKDGVLIRMLLLDEEDGGAPAPVVSKPELQIGDVVRAKSPTSVCRGKKGTAIGCTPTKKSARVQWEDGTEDPVLLVSLMRCQEENENGKPKRKQGDLESMAKDMKAIVTLLRQMHELMVEEAHHTEFEQQINCKRIETARFIAHQFCILQADMH